MERGRRRTLLVAVLLLGPVLVATFPLFEPAEGQPASLRTDAVVVTGNDLTTFQDVPVAELHGATFDGSSWIEIPLQVDERNDANESLFFGASNGLFDANDEVVFLASDAGARAPADEWFIHGGVTRYEVEVLDPLTGETGWVYVHRRAGPQPADYVAFKSANLTVTTPTYSLDFHDTMVTVLEEVRIHEGADGRDLLDRSKFRAFLYRFGLPVSLDEEDLEYELLAYLDGPVRAAALTNTSFILGDGTRTFTTMFFTRDWFNQTAELHLNHQTTWIRYTNDFSASAGTMTYEDSNGNAATVDGLPEALSGPVPEWVQISGPGGTLVTLANASGMAGSQSLYYRDDSTSLEDHFVGAENGQWGDTGVQFDDPPQQVATISGRVHLLPAGVGLVAPDYAAWDSNPLIVTASLQQVDAAVDVTYPAGGETLPGGVLTTMHWNMTAIVPVEQLVVDIHLSTDGGATFPQTIAQGLSGLSNPASHEWTAPFVSTSSVVLRVIATVPGGGSAVGLSGPFAVLTEPPVLENLMISPGRPSVPADVNITVDVVGGFPIWEVWLEADTPAVNISMTPVAGTRTFYASLSYDAPASVTFVIRASDVRGVWASLAGSFEAVDEEAPIAVAQAEPREVPVGGTATFDGSASTDNHRIASYAWSFQDKDAQHLEGAFANYTFLHAGTYEVTLRVEDASGNFDTDVVTVIVASSAGGVRSETVPLADLCALSLLLFGLAAAALWVALWRRMFQDRGPR